MITYTLFYSVDFELLQELAVKASPDILRIHALHSLADPASPFEGNDLRPCGKTINDTVTIRWIYVLCGMTAVAGRFIGVAGVAWSSDSSVLVVCELECAL